MAGEKGKTPSGTKVAGQKEGTPSPDTQTLADVLEQTKAIVAQQGQLAKQLEWQRSVGDKRDQEYRQLLAARRTPPDDDDDDPADERKNARQILDSVLVDRDKVVAELRDEKDLMKFKMNNPDWQEAWKGMQEVIADPSLADLVDIQRKDGTRDIYKSLSYAKAQADTRRLKLAQKEAADADTDAAARKAKDEAQGLLSGGSAAAEDDSIKTDIDLSDPNLKSDDILKKIPQLMDPKDAPKLLSPDTT